MAENRIKIKVHEIAKELGRPSKDILSFLQEKGYEVKAAQSSVDEETAHMVRQTFASAQQDEPTGEQAEKPIKEQKVQTSEKPPTPKARVDENETPKKKKKSIIVVSNPQHSKIYGRSPAGKQEQQQGQQQRQKQSQQNWHGNQYGQTAGKPQGSAPVRPIKPLTPPSPTPSVQMASSKVQQPKPKPTKAGTEKRGEDSIVASLEDVSVRADNESTSLDSNSLANKAPISKPKEGKQGEGILQEGKPQDGRPKESRAQESKLQDGTRESRPREDYQGNKPQDGQREGKPRESSQGRRPREGYQDRKPGESYQDRRAGEGYQGGRPREGYQDRRPGESYQDRRPGESYQDRKSGEGYQGGRPREGYQDRKPGEGYQDRRPREGYQDRRSGEGYQGGKPQEGYNRGGKPQDGRSQGGQTDRFKSNDRGVRQGGQFQSRGGTSNGRPSYNRPEGREAGQGDRRGGSSSQGTGRFGKNTSRDNRGNGGPGDKFRSQQPGKGFPSEAPSKDTDKKREEDKRRFSQEKDRRSKKDHIYEEDDKLKNKPGRFIKPEKKPLHEIEEVIKVIVLPEIITIKELADKMKLQASAIVKKLFLSGKIVTVNQEISYEDAENIAMEYDILCEREVKVDIIEELLKEEDEADEYLVERPPVVCVMGHVDHGKTSLLDAIRKTNVIDKEAGGITQHIGAYSVKRGERRITFLDTPGHEAFTAMRMRGANSTDIAILVVAADDGVMPQTVEAINHAKAAGIEIIVAVNKMDKPSANVDRVKQELTQYELISEDWGGSTVFAPVSAKTGEGIEQLLEMILLTADILELKANPNRMARGLVVEAELDKGRGAVATILVQKGTLHVGAFISAGSSYGKVRAMIDDKGRRVKEAGPSTPVEILGLSDVPGAGEVFLSHESDKTAKTYAETYLTQNKEKMLEETKSRMSLDDLFSQIQEGSLKELNLIVKADVQGSVEAVKQSLVKLSNEEVVVKCIHGGVGAINESDVMLAMTSNAIIIGFNVRPDVAAKTTADRGGVDVRLYKVIYQAIEDIEAAMKGMLDPVYEEKIIGHGEVRQIFKASAIGNIAGSYVLDGYFQKGCKVRISREGNQIHEGSLASIKRFKDDVKEVKAGYECGLVFEGFDQMQELDMVEAYIMVEVPR